MDRTLALTLVLLYFSPLWARPSDYQLSGESPCERLSESGSSPGLHCTVDGHFSPVQCSGGQCWCVDAHGHQLNGTRTSDPAPYCPSQCQLQSSDCSSSGHFQPVQCDATRGQCWCVDTDGMEIYGTRQKGRPYECPGPCSVLSRGLLHSSGPSSGPPQCAHDGSFLPVQCKFINSTDLSQVDLTSAFSSYPEAFQTFSSFKQVFPEFSSYCFCSDSRGREIPHSGLELVLDQVYDSALTGVQYGRSFSESNIYRVLKRRLLGVQLLLTGSFRCPSHCEAHPGASCEADGSFSPTQCLPGGQCWCVDPQGREIPGTREHRDSIHCGSGSSCVSQRRSALLRLFSPALSPDHPRHHPLCSPLLRTLSDLVPVQTDPRTLLHPIAQLLDGLVPSVDSALAALSRSSPKRFLENLFGGKFLKTVAEGNFTGAVGSIGLDRITSEAGHQSIKTHRDMVMTLVHVLEDPGVLLALKDSLRGLDPRLSITEALSPLLSSCSSSASSHQGLSLEFVPRCSASGDFAAVQCHGEQCWCVEPDGREVSGSRTRGHPNRCPSQCERQRSAAIKLQGVLSAGAELHIPTCSVDGHFLSLQCVGRDCFCVDKEGRRTDESPPHCSNRVPLQTDSSSGLCARALAEVTAFKQEVMSLVSLSNSSHFPLGLGFLLAKGFHFTTEIGHSEPSLLKLLSHNTATALRLAAVSVYDQLVAPHKRSFQTFSPQCDAHGHWIPTQCDHSTGQCWCVDDLGHFLPGSLTNRRAPKCASRCKRAHAQTLLSDWLRGRASAPYRPQCEQDGSFSALQTEGVTAVCVNPHTGYKEQEPTVTPAGELTCPGSSRQYQCESESVCETPQCHVPNISHGALQCGPVADGYQPCHLVCSHGYYNALPINNFLCEVQTKSWNDTRPEPTACQIPQPLQTWSWSQSWSWVQSCSESASVESLLLKSLSSRGLCSAQAPVSGGALSLCDENTVELYCEEDSIKLNLTWTLDLSQLKPEDLPDLHTPGEQYSSASKSEYSVGTESVKRAESGVFLNRTRYVESVREMLTHQMTSHSGSQLQLITVTTPRFGCAAGFGLGREEHYCVLCPRGTFSVSGACLLCPTGTYQDQEGRDSCVTCPRGSSGVGASSVYHCQTECQRRHGRCSESGDFLPAQPNFLSGIWGCVTKVGEWLQWTYSETALTDKECTALSNFQLLPESEVLFGYEESQLLRTVAADRTSCLRECALDSSCHHAALLSGQCEMYNTSPENTECTTSPQTKGFLGNPEAEYFQWLRCSVKVRGGASGRQVFRKTGDRYQSGSKSEYSTSETVSGLKRAESGVFRTQVFSANQTTPSDAHLFCLSTCRRDPCCEGFVLNQNLIHSGSLMCGYLHSPAVLMCSEQDWDVIGLGAASRECEAGLTYNERQGNFLFDLGGQTFTFSAADAALTDKKKGYSASLVTSSSVHLYSEPNPQLMGSCASPDVDPGPSHTVDHSVLDSFDPLTLEQVELVPQRQPSLTFWFNKKNYNSHQAMLSCLKRCELESQCLVADLLDLHDGFFFCELFPDTGVCGAYDKPLRRQCRTLLHRAPNNTYTKKVDLSGPVKSFYHRVPFRKMVSYSVRARIPVPETTALSQGFRECERRCDEDHCCRGFGLVRDPKSQSKAGSGPGLVCLPLISLGVQTCPEHPTSWTTQDCSPSELRVAPHPLGWYQKPVNQWTSSPGLCPDFSLDSNKTVMDRDYLTLLSGPEHLLVDPALRTYDVIHLSRDVIRERQTAVDQCLHACDASPSCFGVAVSDIHSGLRCVLYPDTSVCDPNNSCQLTIREPASEVYMRTARRLQPQAVEVPGFGTLLGQTIDLEVDSDRTRAVVQFLGVPFAQQPMGSLRFQPAQPSNWTGVQDATKPRPSCVEPGQTATDGSSEDCLYLNIFTPREQRRELPVLVFFHNAPSGFLDASLLAARGSIVVVTAPYRSSILGFGFADAGLSDQEAVLQWVSAHIYLMGGAKDNITVGAERQGADMLSVHLSKPGRPIFNRIILMGGSVFSPVLVQSESETHHLTLELARELGCDITDSGHVTRCLQDVDLWTLNAAQTRILAKTGPMSGWGPVLRPDRDPNHHLDLLMGTTETDGLISRARTIKNFEELQGRADSKSVFYEALVRSLGRHQDHNRTKDNGQDLLKEAASWFYSLDHSPNPSSYNLFSRALNNATRDLFVVCPSLKMAQVWAQSDASVYMYHLPATPTRTDPLVPLDVQLLFGEPFRFSETEQRLSVIMMNYVSSFIRSGDPNPAQAWPESVLPRWRRVQPYEAMPTYLELSHALKNLQGLRHRECSFWNKLAPTLRGDSGKEHVAPHTSSVGQSQSEKDGYS